MSVATRSTNSDDRGMFEGQRLDKNSLMRGKQYEKDHPAIPKLINNTDFCFVSLLVLNQSD